MVTADGAGPTGTVVMNPDDTASALEEAAAQMPPPPTDGEWEGVDSGEFSVRIDVSKLIADHAKQQADENLPILDDEVDRGDKPPSP